MPCLGLGVGRGRLAIMKKIAVFMSGLLFDSQKKILQGIYERIDALGLDTEVYTFTNHVLTYHGEKVLRGSHHLMRPHSLDVFDGVVIAPNTIVVEEVTRGIFAETKRLGIPTVSIDYEEDGAASIMSGNYKAMRELTEHLVTLHQVREFCYLSGPADNADAKNRKRAFLDVLREHGITLEPDRIYYGNFESESGRLAWKYWEERGILPQAVVCANDSMARGVLIELGLRGIAVPGKILVTGVDNSKIATDCEPCLTTIDRNYDVMGRLACDLLLKAERGEDISGLKEDLDSHLVLSASCGCFHQEHQDFHAFRLSSMVDSYFENEIGSQVQGMMSDFSGAQSFDDVVECLKRYVQWINTEYFYFCMNDLDVVFAADGQEKEGDSIVSLTDGHTEYMTVPLAYENGEYTSFGKFPSAEVLPREAAHKPGVHYVVAPLYYLDESFGYCVFGNSDFPVNREQCYTWLMTISQAIQNVRKNIQLQGMVDRLQGMWIYDTLTGIYNRAGFLHLSKPLMEKAIQNGQEMYLLFMDMDGLKKVNDNLGHEAGDRYIRAIADTLRLAVDEDELVMRYGGDEFAVLGICRDYDRAGEVIRWIEAVLESENSTGSYEFPLSVSIGQETFLPHEVSDLESVMERADQKMYEQKRGKRDRGR